MLTAAERAAYFRAGFLRVPALLADAEVVDLQKEWARLWAVVDRSHPALQWRGHAEEGSVADRIDSAHRLSPRLRSLAADPRLTGAAADLLGAPVTFFKDKLINKLPGTSGYGLHQDWPYWAQFGAPADEMTTLMIALDAADAENGALELWPEQKKRLPPDPGEPLDVDPAALTGVSSDIIEMAAGDGLFFHPLTPHRSAANRSDRPRRCYFITYITAAYSDAAARYAAAQK